MKLAYFTPVPNFLERLVPEFEKLGHTVLVNKVSDDCDFLLCMSISVLDETLTVHQRHPNVPLIVYNWDWYSHIDKTTGRWLQFTQLMREAKDVWSASKITAEACERDTGIKSDAWFYAFVLPEEWHGTTEDEGYVIQASRQDDYKRFDWFEKAAGELNIPFKSYHPNKNSREDYLNAVKHCSFLVISSIEESLGGLTAMEAAYSFKPFMVGNFPGAVEVWKDRTVMYDVNNYEKYKETMKWLWDNRRSLKVLGMTAHNQYYVQQNFTPSVVATRMIKRLEEIK